MHYRSSCKGSCRSGLNSRRSPCRWTVRSCTSFGLMRGDFHRDCCRPRGPAGYHLQSSRGVCPILTKRTATTYTVVGPNCHKRREIQGSRRRLSPAPRKRNTQFQVSQWRRLGVQKRQRSAQHQDRSRPLRSVSAKPKSRQQCSLTWKISRAGWPPSKAAGLLPSRRLVAVRALRCWEFLLPRERQAAQRYMRLALCMEPAQASVAFDSRGPTRRRSASSPTSRPCRSTCKSGQRFWTSPEAHAQEFGVDPSVATTEGVQPMFSTEADEEGEGSSQWAAMPRCSTFCAPVTNAWGYQYGAHLLHHCGDVRTLRRVIVKVAGP